MMTTNGPVVGLLLMDTGVWTVITKCSYIRMETIISLCIS